jgi:poly-gamma-glutamate capsule biosynthesis protein CapA/YwtB (metallophosphatase superfamily)
LRVGAKVSAPKAGCFGPTPSPTATPEPVLTRTLLFSGDVLSHTPVIAQALAYGEPGGQWPYDYRPMFAEVGPRISRADLALCVLETPISVDNTGLTGYPTFNAPRELPDALVDAGYDGCSTASNHSMDRGPRGVRTTLDEMDRVGLGHSGMARTEQESATPRIYDVEGIAIAHLSWTYGLNGFVLPADEPWLVNVNDAERILAEATAARQSGADIVVLSIQWGNEYQRNPSSEQLALAQALTADSDIDLIIGNHVHVVQPIDTVNGVPVVYGVGNSLSNQYDNSARTGTQDGVMIEVTVEGKRSAGFGVTKLAIAPTWVDRTNFEIIDLSVALAAGDLDEATRNVYESSFARTVEAIGLLGHDIPVSD